MFSQRLEDIKKNMAELQAPKTLGKANATSVFSAFMQATIRSTKEEIVTFPRDEVENIFTTFEL